MEECFELAFLKACDQCLPKLNDIELVDGEFLHGILDTPFISFGNYGLQIIGEPVGENRVEIAIHLTRTEEKKGFLGGMKRTFKEFDEKEKNSFRPFGLQGVGSNTFGKTLGIFEMKNFPVDAIKDEILKIVRAVFDLYPSGVADLSEIQSTFYEELFTVKIPKSFDLG